MKVYNLEIIEMMELPSYDGKKTYWHCVARVYLDDVVEGFVIYNTTETMTLHSTINAVKIGGKFVRLK